MDSSQMRSGAAVNVNVARLEKLVADMQGSLAGLMATDIWVTETGESIAGYHAQPGASQLFNKVTDDLMESFTTAGLPGIGRYFLLELEGDGATLIIRHGADLRQGVGFDTRYTNIGTMLALGLPMALRGVEEARTAD